MRRSTAAWKRAIAHDRLGRLHWLSRHGVTFSFDLEAEMTALKAAAPESGLPAGETTAAEFKRAPVVRSIATDGARLDLLLEVPIPQILTEAQSLSANLTFLREFSVSPSAGLASRRPTRALGALTHVGRQGEAPRHAWSDFLYADGRATDSLRMMPDHCRAVGAITDRTPARHRLSGHGVDGPDRRPDCMATLRKLASAFGIA